MATAPLTQKQLSAAIASYNSGGDATAQAKAAGVAPTGASGAAPTAAQGGRAPGVAYETYNSDGSIKQSYTAEQYKASNAAAISSGQDTAPGVGGQIQTGITTPQTAPNNAQINPPNTNQYNNITGAPLASGSSYTNAQGETIQQGSPYKAALTKLQQGGIAPSDAGQAKSAVTGALASTKPIDTTAVDNFLGQDPVMTKLMSSITDLLNPQKQTTTLMEDYQSLRKESGLDQINKEMIDAETVINGTEDDIRNEIQTAGGFGTESQVQAMALARNKSLLARYNQLVQMKTDATNQLNTMSQLNGQDKQMAQQRVDSQINNIFKLADFQQQAQNNIREQAQWLTTTMGADGLYNAYKTDPRQLGFLEKTLGLAPGGLAVVGAQAAAERQRKATLEQAQINSANRANRTNLQFINGTANQPSGTFNPDTGVFTPISTPTGTNEYSTAQAKSSIDILSGLTSMPGLASAVGPNVASRASTGWFDTAKKIIGGAIGGAGVGAAAGAPFAGVGAIPGAIGGGILGGIVGAFSNEGASFSGQKQNFVAGVQQMTEQLTLDKLIQAKQSGATFGALSDGERLLVAAAASKIGTWAIKDSSGNVLGYNAAEKDFKSELDKVNNFQKLDYVLKGGDPTSVGIQVMNDGTLWTQNSDGTMTKLR